MAFFLSGVLLLSFVFFRENKEVPGTVFASTTQQKINETQKEKDALKDKLDGKQDEIDALEQQMKEQLENAPGKSENPSGTGRLCQGDENIFKKSLRKIDLKNRKHRFYGKAVL